MNTYVDNGIQMCYHYVYNQIIIRSDDNEA